MPGLAPATGSNGNADEDLVLGAQGQILEQKRPQVLPEWGGCWVGVAGVGFLKARHNEAEAHNLKKFQVQEEGYIYEPWLLKLLWEYSCRSGSSLHSENGVQRSRYTSNRTGSDGLPCTCGPLGK